MASHSSSAPKTGRCEACSCIFLKEASLTKHIHYHCPVAQERSKRLWKNRVSNIKKLNASLTGSWKRVRDEVTEDYSVQNEQPVNVDQGIELVCNLFLSTEPRSFFF